MKGLTRILALLLVFMMLASTFVSCGRQGSDDDDDSVISQRNRDDDRDEDENEDEDSPTPEATPEETPEATPAVTDEPTPEATPEPTAAAGSTVSVDEALGVIEDSTYTNAYFDFTIELPEDWYKASREEFNSLLNMTASYLSDQSGMSVDLAVAQLLPLFFASEGNPFDGGEGSSIVCLAQNIKDYAALIPDLTTFMNVSLQGFSSQGIEGSFGEVELITLGGQEFAKTIGSTKQMGMTVYQGMYVTFCNDYAINFTITSLDEAGLPQVEAIMNTISFK